MLASREAALGLHALDLRNREAKEQVWEIQRTRILAAMIDVAAERGIGNVTVSHVVERSGVSRRTFYEQFEGREDCFFAAFEESVSRLAARVMEVYREPRPWQERMRASLLVLLEDIEDAPNVARLAIVEALAGGPSLLERRREVLAVLAGAVDAAHEEGGKDAPPEAPLVAEGVVGGALSLVHARLTGADERPMLELVNPLMSMIVLPYRGKAAASRELARKPIARRSDAAPGLGLDSLRDLEMRLTYRTVRVLLAIGKHPGASNRQVADASGIRDQGQVSKLLGRLQGLGLIENTGSSRIKGEPNAWTLTRRGADVREAISSQAS